MNDGVLFEVCRSRKENQKDAEHTERLYKQAAVERINSFLGRTAG